MGVAQQRHHGWLGEQVADPQAGQRPGLGQAPDDDQAGQVRTAGERGRLPRDGVHERLVDDDGAARPAQLGESLVHHPGRVGGVADHDQIGLLGHPRGIQDVRRVEDEPLHLVPCCAQGSLGFGERRVHTHRVRRGKGPGQQHERLRPTGGDQHLAGVAVVPAGDRIGGERRVGVGGEAVQGALEAADQPRRRGVAADVDGEVEQTGGELGVAVVAQRIHQCGCGWAGSSGWSCGVCGAPSLPSKPGSAVR